jgi:hypothetical protein
MSHSYPICTEEIEDSAKLPNKRVPNTLLRAARLFRCAGIRSPSVATLAPHPNIRHYLEAFRLRPSASILLAIVLVLYVAANKYLLDRLRYSRNHYRTCTVPYLVFTLFQVLASLKKAVRAKKYHRSSPVRGNFKLALTQSTKSNQSN